VSAKTCNISETVQDMDQDYYDGLRGSRIRAFYSYQYQWPWMTLNMAKTHSCGKKSFYGAHQKNLN